jgi:hypothetical protein
MPDHSCVTGQRCVLTRFISRLRAGLPNIDAVAGEYLASLLRTALRTALCNPTQAALRAPDPETRDRAYADIVAALTLAKEILRERGRRIDEQ